LVRKLVAFDFDGVLVDSYSELPKIYKEIHQMEPLLKDIPLFEELMLAIEDIMDYLGIWDPFFAFHNIIGLPEEKARELASFYWDSRIKRTKIDEDVRDVILELQRKNIETVILSGTDISPGMKLKRIEESGLDVYFDNIYIHGKKGLGDLRHTLELIIEEHFDYEIFYVDDKTANINKLTDLSDVKLILKKINVPFPLKLSWREPLRKPVPIIERLSELQKIVVEI